MECVWNAPSIGFSLSKYSVIASTRSPFFKLVTFGPTSATIPATSNPKTNGYSLMKAPVAILLIIIF